MAIVPSTLSTFYKGVPPSFQWPVKFCIYNTVVAFVLGAATGNVSQVDRVWTFLPTMYAAYYALLPLWPSKSPLPLYPFLPETAHPDIAHNFSPRALLMFGLIFIWMCRYVTKLVAQSALYRLDISLSYNTWRRGLFNLKDEDYRWAILRSKMSPLLFQVFNLVFIAFMQNVILFVLAVPVQIAAMQQPAKLHVSDYFLAGLALLDVAAEFVADNQQYSFQTFKHSGVRQPKTADWPGARIEWTTADANRGFITRGLWAWSRHPNFFCEQTFWVIINLIPLVAPEYPGYEPPLPLGSGTPLESLFPIIPSLVISSLFFSSTIFTESVSAAKYPEYKAYQQRVSMFVPFLTPVWGLYLKLLGKKEEIDKLVYGQDLPKGKKKAE
ncbi:hypothetical protein DICSQDRAFT_178157 [Dichomitus squalens LYAD-421 SS1]|uniref:DUF1295-domain-containing protein n=1 Tax=Dichomitus squalens TaxID=114155 RepID=A0A4Q9PK98_9APHY|nr:uncharacterized protein DICSQDRAFT_178157 [Dichomitus squalens LYAD-421 SS1]EJF64494.1 hypothetical protein DICSQDRAFT_178157 [Dichomitus squalens LYAD-421 SS1]TBU54563.1 hypothetical protein BD310DRAFT_987563 [Dichomitus squalens]